MCTVLLRFRRVRGKQCLSLCDRRGLLGMLDLISRRNSMTPEQDSRTVSLGWARFRLCVPCLVNLLLVGRHLTLWLSRFRDLSIRMKRRLVLRCVWSTCRTRSTVRPRRQPLCSISDLILLATLCSSVPCCGLLRVLLVISVPRRTPTPILRLEALMLVEPLTKLAPSSIFRRVVLTWLSRATLRPLFLLMTW